MAIQTTTERTKVTFNLVKHENQGSPANPRAVKMPRAFQTPKTFQMPQAVPPLGGFWSSRADKESEKSQSGQTQNARRGEGRRAKTHGPKGCYNRLGIAAWIRVVFSTTVTQHHREV
jgi:hypothetical protein